MNCRGWRGLTVASSVVVLAILTGILGPSSASLQAAISVEFDYRYDQRGFFDAPARRDALELAADHVNRFIDDLSAIRPGLHNSWDLIITRPDTGAEETISNLIVPQDTLLIFVGAQPLDGSLAQAGGWRSSMSGTSSWIDRLRTRGEHGAGETPATDFGPWGGSISFDNTVNWHFGPNSEDLGRLQQDFLSVAMHEIAHVFGLGPSPAWTALVEDGKFTGNEALAVGSSNNTDLTLDDIGAHWQEDTLSSVAGHEQEAALDPSITSGERKWLTDLDRAALRDVGWQEAAAGDVNRDGQVDLFDIYQIKASGAFSAGEGHGFSDGDVDGDGDVDIFDIFKIKTTGLFGTGPYAAQTENSLTETLLIDQVGDVLDAPTEAVGATTELQQMGSDPLLGPQCAAEDVVLRHDAGDDSTIAVAVPEPRTATLLIVGFCVMVALTVGRRHLLRS